MNLSDWLWTQDKTSSSASSMSPLAVGDVTEWMNSKRKETKSMAINKEIWEIFSLVVKCAHDEGKRPGNEVDFHHVTSARETGSMQDACHM